MVLPRASCSAVSSSHARKNTHTLAHSRTHGGFVLLVVVTIFQPTGLPEERRPVRSGLEAIRQQRVRARREP